MVDNTPIVVIHDGFGVPFFKTGDLLIYANISFNINLNSGVFNNVNKNLKKISSNSIII